MKPKRGNRPPAYQRIQSTIRERIENGQLKPGETVDSERDLAKIHSVSLMTARHALAELQREGLVERRRGAGTSVAPPKIHFNMLASLSEEMASRGLSACSKVLSMNVIENAPDIAARLSLPATSRLLVVERLRQAANEPFALETCYLSAEQFSNVRRAALERGSLFALMELEYGINLAHADEEIDSTAADARLSELLSVPRGSPLLRISQVIYSTQGKAVLYVLGLYRSDRHNLRIRRFR